MLELWMKTDERGQATTETVLIVSIGVTCALLLVKKFIEPAFRTLSRAVSQTLENRLLKADLHIYRVSR